ncbi:MAG TPA: hypothetical protein VKE22_06250 [Haliangiales bacterium]|nr:hypothetical protein [Haliangiales bacterium]
MKMEPILQELEAAAGKLGVKVTYEALAETAFGGGLCKVRGSFRVIIDNRGTAGEKEITLARALSRVVDMRRRLPAGWGAGVGRLSPVDSSGSSSGCTMPSGRLRAGSVDTSKSGTRSADDFSMSRMLVEPT